MGSRQRYTQLGCVCDSSGLQQEQLCSSGVTILKQDFSVAMETLQDLQASAVGAPKVASWFCSF